MQIRCVKTEKLIPNTGKEDGNVVLCACSMLNSETCLYRDCEAVGFNAKRNQEVIRAMSAKIEVDGILDFDMSRPDRIVPHRFNPLSPDLQRAQARIRAREEIRSIVNEVDALIADTAKVLPDRLNNDVLSPATPLTLMYNGSDTTNALKDHLRTGSALQSQAGIPEVLRAEARAILNPTPGPIVSKASKTVLAATKLYREYVFMREVPLRNLDDPTKEPWVDDLHRRVKGVDNADNAE